MLSLSCTTKLETGCGLENLCSLSIMECKILQKKPICNYVERNSSS
jgi:hypothetical protein